MSSTAVLDVVVLPAARRIRRHGLSDGGRIGNTSLGHDLHHDVAVGDDADQLPRLRRFHHRHGSDVLLLHDPGNLRNRIAGLAEHGISRHHISALGHLLSSWLFQKP